ncbi:hypothetical protein K9M09_00655 [Patescibacteria group bacterium]|nr:hypothetical protein [Patescibacteria group bacterium]
MLDKKQLAFFLVIVIIVAAISFYSGRMSAAKIGTNTFNNYAGQADRMGAAVNGQGAVMGRAGAGTGTARANMLSGEIMSKDENSLTVKLPDGGSKIVFFSPTTVINQLSTSTLEALNIGQNIVANGNLNSDGSLSALTIESRADGSLLLQRNNFASSSQEFAVPTQLD